MPAAAAVPSWRIEAPWGAALTKSALSRSVLVPLNQCSPFDPKRLVQFEE
jgi:hypothetical protein